MWRQDRDLSKLKAADRAERHRQAKLERRSRWRDRWRRWVAFWKRRAKELQIAAGIAGTVVALWQSPLIVRAARQVMRFGRWARAFYFQRDVGPAEMPKTGTPTTAFDFVDEPTKRTPK